MEKNTIIKFFLTCWCSSHCGDWRFHWPPTFFLDWPRTSISWNSKHYFFWLCSLINQMLNSENFQTLMHRSCHLDRALNIDIGVEYWKIFVVVFSSCCCEVYFGAPSRQKLHWKLGWLMPPFGSLLVVWLKKYFFQE